MVNGIEVTGVISVTLKYKTGEEYRQALGLDARNMPGVRDVLRIMDSVVPKHLAPESATQQEKIKSIEKAIEVALKAIRELAPPALDAAGQYEVDEERN